MNVLVDNLIIFGIVCLSFWITIIIIPLINIPKRPAKSEKIKKYSYNKRVSLKVNIFQKVMAHLTS